MKYFLRSIPCVVNSRQPPPLSLDIKTFNHLPHVTLGICEKKDKANMTSYFSGVINFSGTASDKMADLPITSFIKLTAFTCMSQLVTSTSGKTLEKCLVT